MSDPGQTFIEPKRTWQLQGLLAAVLPVITAAALSSIATRPNIPTWYAGLIKPSFTPPNWVFAPVWTVLYILMAYAVLRVLRLGSAPGRGAALSAFFVQLTLNAAWSWAFFALHSPAMGLLVIVGLSVAILVTIRQFWTLDRVAAYLLAPYAAWVAYAAVLNFSIWWLNA